ncbi:hypothetical protein ACWENR_18150 [Micromonospora sp. NPDC004336]
MRTAVCARLLVPVALLVVALGGAALGGAPDSRGTTALLDTGGVRLVLPAPTPGCDVYRGTSLWDNLFPMCNRSGDPVTQGGGVN